MSVICLGCFRQLYGCFAGATPLPAASRWLRRIAGLCAGSTAPLLMASRLQALPPPAGKELYYHPSPHYRLHIRFYWYDPSVLFRYWSPVNFRTFLSPLLCFVLFFGWLSS